MVHHCHNKQLTLTLINQGAFAPNQFKGKQKMTKKAECENIKRILNSIPKEYQKKAEFLKIKAEFNLINSSTNLIIDTINSLCDLRDLIDEECSLSLYNPVYKKMEKLNANLSDVYGFFKDHKKVLHNKIDELNNIQK